MEPGATILFDSPDRLSGRGRRLKRKPRRQTKVSPRTKSNPCESIRRAAIHESPSEEFCGLSGAASLRVGAAPKDTMEQAPSDPAPAPQ